MSLDIRMGREVQIEPYAVSIGLNLSLDPAQWTFQLFVNNPLRGRQWIQGGKDDNGILVLDAPIDSGKEEKIELWIVRLAPVEPKLTPWTMYQAVLEMVRELKKEEQKSREGHEIVKKIMQANNSVK